MNARGSLIVRTLEEILWELIMERNQASKSFKPIIGKMPWKDGITDSFLLGKILFALENFKENGPGTFKF